MFLIKIKPNKLLLLNLIIAHVNIDQRGYKYYIFDHSCYFNNTDSKRLSSGGINSNKPEICKNCGMIFP